MKNKPARMTEWEDAMAWAHQMSVTYHTRMKVRKARWAPGWVVEFLS